jgi:hypothetical protein
MGISEKIIGLLIGCIINIFASEIFKKEFKNGWIRIRQHAWS